MTQAETNKLEQWRGRLNASGLPVFSRTVRDIRNVSTSHASSAQDLSDVIGHDASMAARVIQIANSPLFNLQNRDIDTINAAVVLVGFDAVRDLMISVSVIEEMLKGRQHARVGHYMARAFHAAAQARSFAKISGEKTEEIFVGALLKHVGEMAFWSRAENEAQAIEAQMSEGAEPAEAERHVLGFELSQLSKVLAEDWNLGDLVNHVLDGHHLDERQVQHVELAHELAEVLELEGWGSPEADALLRRLAKHLGLKRGAVEDIVCANLDEAAAIAERFGVAKLEETLPDVPSKGAASTSRRNSAVQQSGPRGFEADALQAVLSAIADRLEEGAGRDELMQLVISGVHTALGIERVYFALFSPDRTKLHIKYTAGEGDVSGLVGKSCAADTDPLFSRAFAENKTITFDDAHDDGGWHRGGCGAVAAVRLGGRAVGVLYGEVNSGQHLTDEQLSGFRQLGQQIVLILAQAG